ncbi:Rossmann-like and DUF2520 domain-containing protein [Clostridium sp. ZS2-4]|uniref:Rossmann-like and DUF2520 domain-containing protein n=1 Tax=Clostridium sp. ZS2-4 TaxID=2987703 RepID=UPI00227A7D79|nr:Rossmann-like and DUF2520 domain-containing protein [Clostridium sp. ZS2-4]MCY6356276.1 DUF2520 domain-containing protein [Clostridium sp. ZS2-4]
MNIGFIGAGKVGFSLGKYFSVNNMNVTGYYSRTFQSALEASKFTDSKAYKNLEKLVKNSDTIFITTPDDSISDVWQDIERLQIKDKIICHTSGSISSKIFSNINNSGAFGYSIHPMFPFSDKFNTYKSLKDAYFSIEGSEEQLEYLCSCFQSLGNKVITIDKDKKSLYHLSNVIVSNLVLSLLNLGCSYLEECGINSDKSIEALFPLIENNIANLKNKGFIESITGPIERADIGTIQHHISVMKGKDIEIYKSLSLNLLQLSKKKNPQRAYEELEKYLEGI